MHDAIKRLGHTYEALESDVCRKLAAELLVRDTHVLKDLYKAREEVQGGNRQLALKHLEAAITGLGGSLE
jgi:hypothetical protein